MNKTNLVTLAGKFVGQRFGRLIVKSFSRAKQNEVTAHCDCDCGKTVVTRFTYLTNGHTKSCGCLSAKNSSERRKTHGKSRTAEYISWTAMIGRCLNQNNHAYDKYGGRGIYVCGRWRHSFPRFLADMGSRPSPSHSLDRINNNGPYSPSNCRWATPTQQNRNKRMNVVLDFDGRKMVLKEWADYVGVNYKTASARRRKGWSLQRIMASR